MSQSRAREPIARGFNLAERWGQNDKECHFDISLLIVLPTSFCQLVCPEHDGQIRSGS
jgi:hypothetical protein